MATLTRPIAVVTGASTGIGYELAKCCAEDGKDLIIAADEEEIYNAAETLRLMGANVLAVEADLSEMRGVELLWDAIGSCGAPVEYLLANAGRGLGRGFLDQEFGEIQRVVDTNITGTLHLLHKVGDAMRQRERGRILITGSIAGFIPGTYQAVYNGSKAFLDSFSYALRHELWGSGVSVTCLMPGATETEFFERADMMDTKIGQSRKADPAEVARMGYSAMMKGDGEVIVGWQNKLRAAIAQFLPKDATAEMHRRSAEPGRPH